MSKDIDWTIYESRKTEIQKQNLSPDEYERAIQELAQELDASSDDAE